MEREKIAILFSGGLESTSLIEYYKNKNLEITLLYLSFGYIWEEAEYHHVKILASKYNLKILFYDLSNNLNTIQLGEVTSVQKNIIPLRNLSLLSLAALFINNREIYKLAIGLQKDLSYPDTDKSYIKEIEKLINIGLSRKDFKIEIPFYNMQKEKIIQKYKPPLNLIFSCTNPINIERCHKCIKCKKLDFLIKKYS